MKVPTSTTTESNWWRRLLVSTTMISHAQQVPVIFLLFAYFFNFPILCINPIGTGGRAGTMWEAKMAWKSWIQSWIIKPDLDEYEIIRGTITAQASQMFRFRHLLWCAILRGLSVWPRSLVQNHLNRNRGFSYKVARQGNKGLIKLKQHGTPIRNIVHILPRAGDQMDFQDCLE